MFASGYFASGYFGSNVFHSGAGASSALRRANIYDHDYKGGILSQIFTQYVTPEITIADKTTVKEMRVPQEATVKHLKRYSKEHGLDKYMSALIIKEIATKPALVKKVEKTQGLRRKEARELLFDALMEELEFRIEKDEEDVALLMILIEAI